MKNRETRHGSKLAGACLAAVALLVAGLAAHPPTAEAADDVDLLRKQGGKPFVFFIVDTSGSMVLDPDGNWVPASGDDPGSKLFQVKKALYDVLKDVEGVHFGFAGFNQDRLQVQAKHWLYRAETAGDLVDFSYPTAAGEVWNFGRHLNDTGEAGTCASPISLSGNLQELNRFARLGVAGGQTTTLWVTVGGTDYRIQVSLSPDSTGSLGSSSILVRVEAKEVVSCSPVEVAVQGESVDVSFRRLTDFLMVESNGVPSDADNRNCTSDETMDGLWDYTDVLAENTCGSGSSEPFTGRGWDGNTDSGDRADHESLDVCCVHPDEPGVCLDDPDRSDSSILCYNLRFPTTLHPDFDELDKGDQIPFHWQVDHQEEFLRRLNPKHPLGTDFRVASYFEDRPDPLTGLLQLKSEQERPLVGFGNSPLGRAVNDFRCWYRGAQDGKCKGPAFDPGWEEVFRENDIEYGCRVPYLIIVSDGEDNSKGENPSADTANLWAKSGVRSWTFTFKETAQLRSMAQNGKGELILVNDGDDLATELRRIIGFIQEDSRTFASAAVPSVQATVEDKIYFTRFTPLNGTGTWDGHVHSFLRPLPVDSTSGRPDFDHERHLWDSGAVMLDQSPEPATGDTSEIDLKLGAGEDQRRVYYALEPNPTDTQVGEWPENRRFFDRTTDQLDEEDPIEPAEPDLWDGLGLTYDPDDPDSVRETRREAHSIIETTLIQKTYTSEETGTIRYILGDIFHSDPLVIGGPANTQYFIQDAEETFDSSGGTQVQQGTGYREFFLEHENRRKVLLAGANDGMLHAWDAGKARVEQFVDEFGINRRAVRFDNGTGRELFAYVPRSILPTVKDNALHPLAHRWGVDGPPAAGDVFIDPLHPGSPDPDEREWRTVLIGGLREGGSGYFALDLTYPDHLKDDVVGPVGESEQQFDVRVPTDQAVVPDCLDSTGGACGTLRYPAPLWEFTDRIWDDIDREWVVLDEDQNLLPDLGETWSTVDIGRIRVNLSGSEAKKYVAIFGGGLDPDKAGSRGNFLYIVDIETGGILYKRQVEGSVPGDPAAVDTDQDSFIDRIYFGTTDGFLYRLDLVDPEATGVARFPAIEDATVSGLNGRTYTVPRIERGDSSDPLWEPVSIFSSEGRPIYYPPTVLFVPQLGRFAVGFGTGDRDALGFKSNLAGRFYTFVDDSDLTGVEDNLPLTENRLERIDVGEGENPDLLTVGDPGERGWFMVLNSEERMISSPFGLLGVTFFATFQPQVTNETCEVGPGCNQNPQCSLSGNSRVYVVNTTNANAFLEDVSGQPTRFMEVTGFVTEPFAEESGLKNVDGSSDGGDGGGGDDGSDDDVCGGPLTDREERAMAEIMKLFPPNCRFTNQRLDMEFLLSDLQCMRIVPVPICVIEKNWKEISQ